jgi:GT2 family glycosyltransferase
VLVVDNGSSDDSVAAIRVAIPGLTLIELGRNLGYAGGNNVGIKLALDQAADFVLVLNNDTTVSPDLLDRLVVAAMRHPDAAFLSPRILYMDQPSKVWFDGARWNPSTDEFDHPGLDCEESALEDREHETDFSCGAALFCRATAIRQVGLMDQAFFLVWEEVDWCYRAKTAGWRMLVIPSARIWHKVAASFGSDLSPLRVYFDTRNQLLWFRRHATLGSRLRLARKTLARLMPAFIVDKDPAIGLHKRLLWAICDYCGAWLGRGSRVQYLCKRRAILDFARRRFGDCPPEVRAWSLAWATWRKSSTMRKAA